MELNKPVNVTLLETGCYYVQVSQREQTPAEVKLTNGGLKTTTGTTEPERFSVLKVINLCNTYCTHKQILIDNFSIQFVYGHLYENKIGFVNSSGSLFAPQTGRLCKVEYHRLLYYIYFYKTFVKIHDFSQSYDGNYQTWI